MKLAGLLLSIFFLTLTASAQTLPVEPGVSEQLARYRKSVIDRLRYELEVSLVPDLPGYGHAHVTASFQLRNNRQPLQLDYRGAATDIVSVEVNDQDVPADFRNEHLVIDPKYLRQGRNIVHVFYALNELAFNRGAGFQYTLLVPDRTRTLFPCFDQPDLKARYELEITVPEGWTALSNGIRTEQKAEGFRRYRFASNDRFSTYLFSLVAGAFTTSTQSVNGKPSTFFHRETDTAKMAASLDSIYALHTKAVRFLEQYTTFPFPFSKLDFAAIPDFQYGGMEHVGAIDYKASSLFLDRSATKDQRQARASLVAHEVAHMWFGDLVTMKWFNDVWMKEVFANFMADKITENPANRDAYRLKFIGHLPRAYSVDRTTGAHPIRQTLPNLNEAGTLYGPIIYDKAPVMMGQLELLMGETAFRDGLREYLKTYAYGNADWNDLIRILDKRTPADLQQWNEAWVNGAGRPVITYQLQSSNGKIQRLVIHQRGEQKGTPALPQQFDIALVYDKRVEEVRVQLNGDSIVVRSVAGKQVPLFFLFNSSGIGYGRFPVDAQMQASDLPKGVMRASAYINQWEQLLDREGPPPAEVLQSFSNALLREAEPLNQSMLAGYIGDLYWRILRPEQRNDVSLVLEDRIWKAVREEKEAGKKKTLYRLFSNIALNEAALDTLYALWKTQTPPAGLKLSDDEYTTLALQLTVKGHRDTAILAQQLARLTNADRKARLQFLMPALSSDPAVRDSFFHSLRDPLVRKKESWVQDALGYLHHPLRQTTSIRYLKESLELLEEVRRTGDIFFPSGWLTATQGSYQSKEAADIVRGFLSTHPNYDAQLRRKILQAADPLFRAVGF